MGLEPVLKNTTLADKAYQIIRNAIVFHELKPNDSLTEERLSEELSISRTPLRTALHRLVDEGLAEARGKSIVVSTMSDEDIANVHVVRCRLELLVMERLRGKVTKPLLAQLRETIARQAESYMSTAEDYMEYIHQDYLFHSGLARGTGNKFLLDLTERINTHSNRCLMLVPNLPFAYSHATQEHTQIVDALEREDFDAAYQCMEYHLGQVVQRFRPFSQDHESS